MKDNINLSQKQLDMFKIFSDIFLEKNTGNFSIWKIDSRTHSQIVESIIKWRLFVDDFNLTLTFDNHMSIAEYFDVEKQCDCISIIITGSPYIDRIIINENVKNYNYYLCFAEILPLYNLRNIEKSKIVRCDKCGKEKE